MKLNSKHLCLSIQLRFVTLCSITIIAALITQYSYAETPPTFSVRADRGVGTFEKIIKKSNESVVTQDENSDAGIATVADDENEEQVIPLPMIDDEVGETTESSTETDEAIVTDITDIAEVQPSVKEQEDIADGQWAGWLTDYRKACLQGKLEQKMVLVYFYDTNTKSPYLAFETESLADKEVQKSLEEYILVRIPVTVKLSPTGKQGAIQLPGTEDDQKQLDKDSEDADEDDTVLAENVTQIDGKTVITQTIYPTPQPFSENRYTALRPSGETIDATRLVAPGRDMGSVAQLKAETFDLMFSNLTQETMLIRHPAFYEMLNTPGIAIIDFKHKDAEYYGKIVSVFPFLKKQPYTVEQTRAMLTLPPGTVTQRSVIFAVRIHPDSPQSTSGELSPRLVEESRSASQYQADIRKQGHHNWDRRFQQINIYLPTELWACEVCAESWEGQHLLESAIECVACWRYSEGHWSAVSAEHPYYGYDMKLGTNGIWYGTGVFGKWRHPTLAKAGTLSGGQSQQLPKR